MQKILFIGLIGYSYFYKVKENIALGETVLADEFHTEIGGKGFNQAYMASLLKADATFLTVVAEDEIAPLIEKDLAKTKVKTKIYYQKGQNVVASIITNKQNNNVYLSHNISFKNVDFKFIEAAINESSIIVLTNELDEDTINKIIACAKEHHKYIIFNYSPVVSKTSCLIPSTFIVSALDIYVAPFSPLVMITCKFWDVMSSFVLKIVLASFSLTMIKSMFFKAKFPLTGE